MATEAHSCLEARLTWDANCHVWRCPDCGEIHWTSDALGDERRPEIKHDPDPVDDSAAAQGGRMIFEGWEWLGPFKIRLWLRIEGNLTTVTLEAPMWNPVRGIERAARLWSQGGRAA